MKYLIPILLLSVSVVFAQTDYSGRNATYRTTPEIKNQLKHTLLKVSFNFDNQTLNGEEWLTASPYFYATDSLILDAKSMLIHEVKMNNQPLNYTYEKDFLKIKLDKIYQKGENYSVYIRYTAQPETILTEEGELSDNKGLYFINPKGEQKDVPTQVWTQGQIESSSCWFPTIDRPNQKTTQEIYITVPDKFVTLSNGVLKSSQKNNDLRTDHWVMDKPHAPYLFFMGVGDFAVVKDTPWRGAIAVDYYVEKPYQAVAKQIFGHTAEMMEFYSQKFGYDFPWQKYSQMVVRDFVAGAMENTTAVSHAESAHQSAEVLADKNYWEAVIAHEMGHHWFGNLVTAESWANLTINESFANYCEYLWYEYKYGKDTAEHHLMDNANRYVHHRGSFEKHLVRFGYKKHGEMFDEVSYSKGGTILNMLRDYLGDEAFFGGITDFLKSNEYGTGEAHQLRMAFEKVSGKDLNWFFNQWFFGYGHPVIEVQKTYQGNKLLVNIKQIQGSDVFFEFPLEIDIHHKENYKRHRVWVNAQSENLFEFALDTNPDLVNINPRGIILMSKQDNKSIAQYQLQYHNTKEFKSRWEAVEFAQELGDKKLLFVALKDPFYEIRIKALEGLSSQKLTKKELAQIEKIAQNDPKNLVKSAAIWTLSYTKDRKYLPLFEKALTIPSASVRNAGLKGISEINPLRAKEFLLKMNSDDISTDQLIWLAPAIVDGQKTEMQKYLSRLLPLSIYYPTYKNESQNKSETFHKIYQWAMSIDHTDMLFLFAEHLKDLAQYTEKGSDLNNDIIQILNEGISIKQSLPQSSSIIEQIRILEALKKLF